MASGLTSTYLLPYPLQTDAVDVASDVQALAQAVDDQLILKAPLASPTFTGIPLSTTADPDTSTTQIATTAFVVNQGYLKSSAASSTYAPLASPALTGNPTAPTQTLGNSSTRIATTAFVANALSNFVTLPSQTGANGKFLSSDGTNASWNTIAIKDVSNLENTFSNLATTYAPFNITIDTKTTNYTLALTDSGKQIEMSLSSANYLYIPTDASVNFPIGTSIIIVQLGTGQTTIEASTPSTTTVISTPGKKLRTQYSVCTLVKRQANNWIISGDLVA